MVLSLSFIFLTFFISVLAFCLFYLCVSIHVWHQNITLLYVYLFLVGIHYFFLSSYLILVLSFRFFIFISFVYVYLCFGDHYFYFIIVNERSIFFSMILKVFFSFIARKYSLADVFIHFYILNSDLCPNMRTVLLWKNMEACLLPTNILVTARF